MTKLKSFTSPPSLPLMLLLLCLSSVGFVSVNGYLSIIDEHYEDPNFPEMCVTELWDRIVPVGYSYPVPRQSLEHLGGSIPRGGVSPGLFPSSPYASPSSASSSASPAGASGSDLLPPCEQIACVKTRRKGRVVFTLQINGCDGGIYSRNRDPNCDVFIPDQRLPFPMCCPQRACPSYYTPYYGSNRNQQQQQRRSGVNNNNNNHHVVLHKTLLGPDYHHHNKVGDAQQRSSSSSSSLAATAAVAGDISAAAGAQPVLLVNSSSDESPEVPSPLVPAFYNLLLPPHHHLHQHPSAPATVLSLSATP